MESVSFPFPFYSLPFPALHSLPYYCRVFLCPPSTPCITSGRQGRLHQRNLVMWLPNRLMNLCAFQSPEQSKADRICSRTACVEAKSLGR